MPAVPAHPMPVDLMLLHQLIQPLPEITVLDRLALRRSPAVALPLLNPPVDALPQVFGVGSDGHPARSRQLLERGDRGLQLHPVVGRFRGSTADELLGVPITQQGCPAARTRIAPAGPVGEDLNGGVQSGSTRSVSGTPPGRASVPETRTGANPGAHRAPA